MSDPLFEGFVEREPQTDRGVIYARVGGRGPTLSSLHGYPQTHLMWHTAAARLADQCTGIVTDLAGYGASRPVPAPDHAPYSRRTMASDQVQAMAELGHERFAVVRHDRGARVAYRMALDHPERVEAVAVPDVVPTGEVRARTHASLALTYWHRAFLGQPTPLPERLIAGDPNTFFDLHVRALGLGAAPDRYPPKLIAAYRRLLDDPTTVRRSARTTAPAPRSIAATTTPTAQACDGSNIRSPSGTPAVPSGASMRTCSRCGAHGHGR